LAALTDDAQDNDTRSTAARSCDIIPLTWQLDTEAVLIWPRSIGERAANGDRGESWKPESTAALVITGLEKA
jgi:hypothetical protein